jgi:hypothetical protein
VVGPHVGVRAQGRLYWLRIGPCEVMVAHLETRAKSLLMSTARKIKSLLERVGRRSLKILMWTNAFDPSVAGFVIQAGL